MRKIVLASECIESEELAAKETGEKIRQTICKWLKNTSFVDFRNAIKKSVIGQEELENVLLSIYTYLEKIGRGYSNADAILLAAPSGCGKTETYRAVRSYFKDEIPELPCYQVDLSGITQSGFQGKETDSILRELFYHSNTNGIGLVWLDEIDKKIIPTYESNGGNVNAHVQYELLTMIEGRECESGSNVIDTNNTLFIGLGAFDFFRNDRENEPNEIGFGSERKEVDHYEGISRENLISAGGCYELIGRFSSIYNYRKLTDDDVRRIINLIREKEEEDMDLTVEIDETAVKEFVSMNNSKFGCRLIRSKVHNRIMSQVKIIKCKRLNTKKYKVVLSASGDRVDKIA